MENTNHNVKQDVITYMGTFDDQVQKHLLANDLPGVAKDDLQSQINHVNRSLFEAAIVGTPVLIGDGHVVLTPGVRATLSQRTSPLRILGEAGYARLAKRLPGQPLSALFPWAEREGIDSYIDFARDREEFSAIMKDADEFDSQVCACGGEFPWPKQKDIGAGFVRWIQAVSERHSDPVEINVHYRQFFRMAVDEFLREVEGDPRKPRTKWERKAEDVAARANQRSLLRWLMRFANATYHFNVASCWETPGVQVVPQTLFSPSFLDFVQGTKRFPSVEETALTSIPPIRIPRSVDFSDGTKLIRIVTSGESLFDAKELYLRAVARLLLERTRDARKAAEEAADVYSHRLYEHFVGDSRVLTETATYTLHLAFLLASHSPWIGLALVSANHFLVPPTVRTIRERFLTSYEELNAEQARTVVKMEWDRVKTMSVRLGGDEYKALKESIPEWQG